ncbi:hypothetical protein P3S67_031248 [Capsicum chacoense]
MRMTDDGGDTALNKAVRTGSNNAGETPLYLAAESGLVNCLSEILEHCNRTTYSSPCGRTALHAAIIQKQMDCAASLWEWNKSLCKETDKWDWNPLNYAVKQGLRVVARKMLGWKTSLAYTHTGNGNDWATSIHIAAYEGRVNMKHKTLHVAQPFQRCPLRHCRLGPLDFEIKWQKMQKPEDETEPKGMLKDIMEATQIHLVVATLLVTVTFAAGFTLPGGFESDLNSSNKGMAIVIRETVFRAFVVSDAIALHALLVLYSTTSTLR